MSIESKPKKYKNEDNLTPQERQNKRKERLSKRRSKGLKLAKRRRKARAKRLAERQSRIYFRTGVHDKDLEEI